MKNKIYLFSIAGCFAAVLGSAQCSVTITSLSSSGMTVIAHASGTGNMNPGYEWDWGDSTAASYGANANHTFANAGGHQVCVTYVDSVNPFNCVANDCDSIYLFSPGGIGSNIELKAELKTSPNPFSAFTHISLSLNKPADVEIVVYDITGKEVEKIQDGPMDFGMHVFTWKPETLADGIYFLKVKSGTMEQTRKILHTNGN